MDQTNIPRLFRQLQSEGCINPSDIEKTSDGFCLANKSLCDILSAKGIFDFLDSEGVLHSCSRFFDDWFVYAVPDGQDYAYSLLKFREQEYDAASGIPADGDAPGVTISFVSFAWAILMDCLMDPSAGNRQKLNSEINRVVAYRGQQHHTALKNYFANPESEGAYLVAHLYTNHIASFAEGGCLPVPEHYKEIYRQSISHKNSAHLARLPDFLESVNQSAGYIVCDHEKIYIKDRIQPDCYECAAILATHTGNVSVYSFAAEVEYHARFLTPLAKVRVPFFGKSVYDSAIRADMTIDDSEFTGPAPFYKEASAIVKRQYFLHAAKADQQS